MINIKTRYIRIAGLFYLFIPVLIFFLGWLHWYLSVSLCLLMCLGLYKTVLATGGTTLTVSWKKLLFILLILLLWSILSGVGRYVWQNEDHYWRNAIFNDLVNYDWPVTNGNYSLCYYFGYWLPAALIGKLFSSIAVGNVFLLLWTWIGLSFFYFLISDYLKQVRIGILFVLIFFSGIDLFGYAALYLKTHSFSALLSHLTTFPHLEWSHIPFQASSISTLLFWVFNQAVPFFVGMMLLLLNKNWKFAPFQYSLLLIFSPFPFVGFAPVMAYWGIKEGRKTGWGTFLKKNMTLENLAAIFIILVVGIFYLSNIAAGESGFRTPTSKYLFYLLTQYVIYFFFIFKTNSRDPLLWTLFITCLVLSLVNLGESTDFCMRTNIPLTIYLMLLVMKYMYTVSVEKKMKTLLIVVFMLGAITPFFEIARTVRETCLCISLGEDCERKFTMDDSIFDKKLTGPNFLSREESLFNRYLMK